MAIEIYQYYLENPWRYQYSSNPNIGGGWIKDGVAFYAFAEQREGTVPVYQYHADNPLRFQYHLNPNIGQGWTNDGVAFYAFKDPTRDSRSHAPVETSSNVWICPAFM
ncbi:MAG: hypothetical protein ACFKPT_24495 [Gloeotrichia echinulata GP01]